MTKVTEPLPGTVFTPRGYRILKFAVGTMTVLLIAGIAALFYGVTLQLSKLGEGSKQASPAAAAVPAAVEPAGPAPYARVIDLGPGKLEGIAASGNFAVLLWKGEASDIVLMVDPRTGTEAGRIQVPHH
jgi:hypothetical protein